ncbi:50S ribosomal protein L4 [Candidatus Collierbacteria bacterium RIFCSPLOWO2_01_FULL_50_23]|uniref:Large ribosomal subunit protein uL4 n=1 Tax=Candidatus Collierbacteria bacterium RIFCSPHIGHO2_01_FULL_50_25 TaxID=1817722 RepID=A0A1F5EWA3_9BACT|nr:ribosomal protein L4 [uncultured bacterium]OGD71667.1 MAG: 50S ribosomal protein L4 [Candidatus Collierbacteria bacterium RIFCSPHIGHO2_01_FULL_50_25]OGD73979.1 MAG: 50S ribosomal protein L4 [Candidatus Collierbacteria bacterium RIFCSPLOWO2_01_FULL_50_23]
MATKTTKTTTNKLPAKRANKTNEPNLTNILDPRVFNYQVSDALLAQVIHVYRDNTHQNTSKVKTRGELTKTTKKMYKQKGTGNARHGSKMSPTFVGGGVAFGPTGVKPGNLKINRKMRAAALAGILSLYAKDKAIELVTFPEVMKPEVKLVKTLLPKPDTLLVYAKETPALISSVRNLDNVSLIEAAKLNAYLIAGSRFVTLTPSAHEALVARVLPLLKAHKFDKLAK